MPIDASTIAGRLADLTAGSVAPGGPGMIIGVRRRDQAPILAADGLADVERGTWLKPEARLPIASVTKAMTSLCVLRLAERGLLDLAAPIGAYLPELPPAARRPTLRQLLNHTSGLRCHLDLELFSGYARPRPDGFGWATLTAMSTVNAEPGAWQVYGNTGHHLAALAIARVTGRPFATVMREQVFAPLGMSHTEVMPGAGVAVAGLTLGYVADADGWRSIDHLRSESLGEGGVVSTATDLLTFASALRTEDPAIAPSIWRELKTIAEGAEVGYGLGVSVQRWRGLRLIGHGGSLIGYSSALWSAPEVGVDVVVLANTGLDAETLARRALAVAIGEDALELEPAAVSATGAAEALVGGVFADEALVVGFAAAGEALTLTYQGVPGLPLRPGPDDGEWVFAGNVGLLRVRPLDADRLEIVSGGERRTLERQASPPPAAALGGIAGRFRNRDLGVELTLRPQDDGLSAVTSGPYGRSKGVATPIAPGVLSVRTEMNLFLLRYEPGPLARSTIWLDTARTRRLPLERVEGGQA